MKKTIIPLISLIVALSSGIAYSANKEPEPAKVKTVEEPRKPVALLVSGHPDSKGVISGWGREGYDIVKTNAYSKQAFLDTIKSTGEKYKGIDFLLFSTHGSDSYLYFTNDWISVSDIKRGILEGYEKHFNRKPGVNNCIITACNTAESEEGSVAEHFFKALKINGVAPKTRESFTPKLDEMLWPVSSVPNVEYLDFPGPSKKGEGHFDYEHEGVVYSVNMSTNGNISSISYPSDSSYDGSLVYKLEKGKLPLPALKDWKHTEAITNGVLNLKWENLRRFCFTE
jgi:hypothetical protein|tara:strand:- start:15 stop:866 length:852 start_codon:yes stop_codon:yes gene_type:complete